MMARHHLHTAAPVPAHVPPSTVIAALHGHNTALSLQALSQGHQKLDQTDPRTLKDTYWYPTDLHPVTTYQVSEVIQVLPVFTWARTVITFPFCFQDTPDGIRTRADAPGGVIVRAEFRVVRGGAAAEVEGEGEGIGDAEWVLVEDVQVSCASYMMPFVRGRMEAAHRGICAKVLEQVEMDMRHQAVAVAEAVAVAVADSSPRRRRLMDTGKSLPGLPQQAVHAPTPQTFSGLVEADALGTQRFEMSADQPEKITYR